MGVCQLARSPSLSLSLSLSLSPPVSPLRVVHERSMKAGTTYLAWCDRPMNAQVVKSLSHQVVNAIQIAFSTLSRPQPASPQHDPSSIPEHVFQAFILPILNSQFLDAEHPLQPLSDSSAGKKKERENGKPNRDTSPSWAHRLTAYD